MEEFKVFRSDKVFLVIPVDVEWNEASEAYELTLDQAHDLTDKLQEALGV